MENVNIVKRVRAKYAGNDAKFAWFKGTSLIARKPEETAIGSGGKPMVPV
jgi:hypothetical protein